MSVIEVRGLTKSYGDFHAVREIDFNVERGEVFALLGPNGAGKTTTVEILEGYRERSGGTVSVLECDPATPSPPFRSRVGVVSQGDTYPRFSTVREVLVMTAAYFPHPRRVDEVIELVGLEDKRGEMIRNLSGGQQRRLDLAAALVGNPEVLFVDEPTTGFDPAARRDAWSSIRSLRETGTTVVLTTHYMEEAQYLADRVAVLVNGKIVASGSPETLGGRDTASTSITFSLPPGVNANAIPPVGEELELDGSKVTIRASKGTRSVHRLTGWALDNGHELLDLQVTRPSLEDIYLDLTSTAGNATTRLVAAAIAQT